MKLIDKLFFHLACPKLNVLKTLYFNFRMLPIREAIKLPIYIYGPVKFYWLNGKVKLHTNEIYSGMIKLGCNNEFFNGVDNSSFIYITEGGTIIFEGPCAISNNYKIRVSNNATLTLGKCSFFGSSVKFICTKGIKIGKYTRCAYETQFVDTNSHFVLNQRTGEVARRDGYIEIGDFNWIGNRSSITKGSKTKGSTIVSANSLLNKDYTISENEHQLLGGTPAREIAYGLKRIFSTEIEKEIIRHFKDSNCSKFILKNQKEDNLSSIDSWFKNVM